MLLAGCGARNQHIERNSNVPHVDVLTVCDMWTTKIDLSARLEAPST